MSAVALVQLVQRRVEKPWGRRDLPPQFDGDGAAATGEIWFEHPRGRDLPLLIKYLFTSERLSIQVHPDDALAAEHGHKRGKDEAWLILDAEPGATLGVGLSRDLQPDELRAAALDGSIEQLVSWQPVRPGEVYYSPAGTVHAIGAGLVLLEVQQNVDLTYRLYDYGRPRELHLDQGVAASKPGRSARRSHERPLSATRSVAAEGHAFTMERLTGPGTAALAASPDRPVWLVPLHGISEGNGVALEPGTAWLAESSATLTLAAGAELIATYLPGASPIGSA